MEETSPFFIREFPTLLRRRTVARAGEMGLKTADVVQEAMEIYFKKYNSKNCNCHATKQK